VNGAEKRAALAENLLRELQLSHDKAWFRFMSSRPGTPQSVASRAELEALDARILRARAEVEGRRWLERA
jgi:hypothetical protein